jgi:PAS domain S-box-containing protein
MKDLDSLSRHVRRLRERVEALQPVSSGETPIDEHRADVREDFLLSLTELEVAEEKLRQQSESLGDLAHALEAERRRYQDLFEFAPDAYLITDREGTIRQANRVAADLLDIEPSALVGKPMIVFIGKAQKGAFRSRLNQLNASEAHKDWQTTLVSRSNRAIPVSITVAASISAEKSGRGSSGMVRWLIRDNTARYQAEQAAAEKTEAFEALFDASPEAIVTLDANGRITMWNAAAERLLGWTAWDMMGKPLRMAVKEQDRFKNLNLWQEVQRKGSCPRGWPLQIKTRAGDVVDTSVSIGGLIDTRGGIRGCIVIISDMSDRKRAAQAKGRSDQQLRHLLQRLQAVREEERKRMARDIHDHMGQALTQLNFDLARLRQQLELPESGKAGLQIEQMQNVVLDLTRVVQRVSAELRPGILDDLGLPAAIEWQAQEFTKRTEIACEVDLKANEGFTPPPEVAIAVFRIYQELLTNVARHAQATLVMTSFTDTGDWLVLTVSDNGIGMSPEQWTDSSSLGLLGMRERVMLIGGEIQLQSSPGEGAMITVRVPSGR